MHYILGTMVCPHSTVSLYYWIYGWVRTQSCTKVQKIWNRLFQITNLMHNSFILQQHVSSSTLLIFRRTDCITTASGIGTLCKQLYSMPVESGLQSALNRHTVRLFVKSDDTRGCSNTICPPEDEQGAARNMLLKNKGIVH